MKVFLIWSGSRSKEVDEVKEFMVMVLYCSSLEESIRIRIG